MHMECFPIGPYECTTPQLPKFVSSLKFLLVQILNKFLNPIWIYWWQSLMYKVEVLECFNCVTTLQVKDTWWNTEIGKTVMKWEKESSYQQTCLVFCEKNFFHYSKNIRNILHWIIVQFGEHSLLHDWICRSKHVLKAICKIFSILASLGGVSYYALSSKV